MSASTDGAPALCVELQAVFPWLSSLPGNEAVSFHAEVVDALRESASVGDYTTLESAIEAWKATAEIYADPELLALATAPLSLEA